MRTSGILFLISLPLALQAQTISVGVTGGLPLDKTTSTVGIGTVDNKRYTVGVSIEGYLNEHVSLDFNPLFKRTDSSSVTSFPLGIAAPTLTQLVETTSRNHSLELPLIGKYTFRQRGDTWRPFVGAGFAFQTAWQTDRKQSVFSGDNLVPLALLAKPVDQRSPFDVGAVFSSGIRMQRGRFQLVPELRYTRWGGSNMTHHRDQPELLFSIRF